MPFGPRDSLQTTCKTSPANCRHNENTLSWCYVAVRVIFSHRNYGFTSPPVKNMVTVILILPESGFQVKTWHNLTSAGYFRWHTFAPCDSVPLKQEHHFPLFFLKLLCVRNSQRCTGVQFTAFNGNEKELISLSYDRRRLLPQLWHVIYPNLASITGLLVDLTLLTWASI